MTDTLKFELPAPDISTVRAGKRMTLGLIFHDAS